MPQTKMRRYMVDQNGSVSVEFVLTFPLLFLWLVLSFVFYDAYKTLSQTEKIAYTVSDIMSRKEVVGDTDMTELAALANKMLPPRLDQRVTRITSICYEDEKYKVMWSYSDVDDGLTGYDPHNDNTIPTDILPAMDAQTSIILTEVRARWRPLSRIGFIADQQWTNQLVTRPRFTTIIPHDTLNANTTCPRDSDDGDG